MAQQSKKSFVMGLVTGLGICIVLGGVFLMGSKFGGGSLALGGSNAPAANQPSAAANQPSANQPTQPEGDATKIAAVTSADHIRGNTNAPITMIEYSDFECPFCLQFHSTLSQVLTDYKDKVRLVYREFPLRSIHPQAEKGAEAAECASDQGKFWEMHDKLFDLNQAQNLNVDSMKAAAKDIGLNTSKFNDCLDNGKAAAAVEKDYQDGIAGGIAGTPGTFINGQYLAGALPYSDVKTIIDGLLKKS